MADNLTLNSGSGGAILATDESAGSVHYQIVKLADGTANSTTVIASGGGVESAALRVTVASDSTGVLSVDDNGASLTIDNAALSVTGGGVEASALRVTLASDSTGVLSVDDNGGSLTVDNPALSVTGGGVEASALRVTIASDSTGVVSIDDNGGSLTVDGTVAVSGTVTVDSELPAAAALADNTANPTVPAVGAFGMVYDGTTWDRMPGTSADGVTVNLGANNDVTVTGTVTANLGATDTANLAAVKTAVETIDNAIAGTEMQVDVVASLPAGTNAIGKLAANSGVDIGDVDVTSISAGSNLIGDVGISGARTSGGTTLYKNLDVDETEDQIKGTAGQLYWIHAVNLSAAVLFLKFYNATAASVTVGTTVPDLTFPIPTQGDTNGAGFTLSIPNGIAFGTAITIACTTGIADNNAGAPAANVCVVNLGYA